MSVSSPTAKTVTLIAHFSLIPYVLISVPSGIQTCSRLSAVLGASPFSCCGPYSSRRHAAPYHTEESSHPGNLLTWPSIFWSSGLSCMCHYPSQGAYNHTTVRRQAIPHHTGKGSNTMIALLALPSHGTVSVAHLNTHCIASTNSSPVHLWFHRSSCVVWLFLGRHEQMSTLDGAAATKQRSVSIHFQLSKPVSLSGLLTKVWGRGYLWKAHHAWVTIHKSQILGALYTTFR